ncbi:MAG: type II CRISPR RNA-guided endonuclease Cas9 [Candidatus Zixiibacteriota bacterium]
MSGENEKSVYLGIDLGPNSVGWALIDTSGAGTCELVSSGVRVFEAGLDKLESDGKGESRNVARREARQARRGVERRARRLAKIANVLQRAGLLPEGDLTDSEMRHMVITELDLKVDNPYKLRARALDAKLSEHELGRALYHLAQRRGFLSNRKSTPKKDDDTGKVKKDISQLKQAIEAAGARTLGEYFSRLDPFQHRIRMHYTHRSMYEDEFKKIWESQRRFHPDVLTDDLRKKLHRAIFFQRPLKSQAHLIGKCELEPKYHRAPMALLCAQRFRYLQTINNLRVIDAPGRETDSLTVAEQFALAQELEFKQEMTFGAVRRLLKLPNTSKFSIELGGEKKIKGNRTAAKLAAIFGVDRWKSMTPEEHDAVVEDWRSIVKEETLKKRAITKWGLDEAAADELSSLELEEGYSSLSRQAIIKLLPRLGCGEAVQTAIKAVYPQRFERIGIAVDYLPSVREHFASLRNPIVERSLTELRRVINAIVREYGKPAVIRVELARELKQPAKSRQETVKRNRANEEDRKWAAEKILEEARIANPSRSDILRVLLAEECEWTCPYTGKHFGMTEIVGDSPQFDIEHIIPLHRCLDDSYMNKTLCLAKENRNGKRDRTPFEAYSGTPQWDDIIDRVSRFKGKAAPAKLRRFRMKPEEVNELLHNFTWRQLNDTAYASRLAKEYLGLLYGGQDSDGIDSSGHRRVQSTNGQVTAFLRNVWDLNKILGDGPGKSRDDHRHHAVDAIVVALTDQGVVKRLSDAASPAARERRRQFGKVPPPWETFDEDVRRVIGQLVVSHHLDRRVRGQLHKDTFYSVQREDKDGKKYVHIRKRIEDLKPKELEDIVDKGVRLAIEKKLQDLGESNPARAFKNIANHPVMTGKDGSTRPVHKVRIKDHQSTVDVGSGHRLRRVVLGNNHHMEIVKVLDEKGNTKRWEGYVVSLLEAWKRLNKEEPVVKKDHGPGKCFLFSLANGDVIELDHENGQRGLCVVRTIETNSKIRWVKTNDARKLAGRSKSGETARPDPLRKRNCVKMTVDPLGRVRRARD